VNRDRLLRYGEAVERGEQINGKAGPADSSGDSTVSVGEAMLLWGGIRFYLKYGESLFNCKVPRVRVAYVHPIHSYSVAVDDILSCKTGWGVCGPLKSQSARF
jgi:hypothetical protein